MKKMKTYLLYGIGVVGIALGSASVSLANCPVVSPCPTAQIDTTKDDGKGIATYQPVCSPQLTTQMDKFVAKDDGRQPVATYQPVVSPKG